MSHLTYNFGEESFHAITCTGTGDTQNTKRLDRKCTKKHAKTHKILN